MNISRFFIDRPIFAAVIAVVIAIIGIFAYPLLPLSQYPEIAPPTITINAAYPGASAETLAETVAAPIEQEVNGVEKMLYITSSSTSDGAVAITVTFQPGTDLDAAQVLVQNRVALAEPRLPEAVRQTGVVVNKAESGFLMILGLTSPDGSLDNDYVGNYANSTLRDRLLRIEGVGAAQVFGGGNYSMRVWIDPAKAAERDLTGPDIVAALRAQNVQAAAGSIGQPPFPTNAAAFQLPVQVQGRLTDPDQFYNVVLKTDAQGRVTYLRDVARIELGAQDYGIRGFFDGKRGVGVAIIQQPGANALGTAERVLKEVEAIKAQLPAGMAISVPYNPTEFVAASVESVQHTLVEAVILVVIVIMVFLQTWRAAIIPIVAIPVALVGTFAVQLALGYSINSLSLFALVLAVGIVVDDAIVVVENVERHIEAGQTPLEAAHLAMREVSGPIIAIALVLCAVFVPMAFLTGVTGQFYKQFAVTIAISTVISAINSLTLSPALAAKLLRPHGAEKDAPSRLIDRLFGWLFRPFNRFFKRSSQRYEHAVSRSLGRRGAVFVVYLVLLAGAALMFRTVPAGFIPVQDKLYLIAGVKMPEGASIERTDAVLRRMAAIAKEVEGVESEVAFPGLNPLQFTNTPNNGVVFFTLKPFSERARSAEAITAELNQKFASIQEGFTFAFMPPPIQGLGNGSGWSLFVEDRTRLGYGELQSAVQAFQGAAVQTPGLGYPITSYQANVPQLDAEVDRVKAKAQGVPLTDLFETLQVYLGSAYVNDFNMFGRTWQVIAQADGPFRDDVEDIANLHTRNAAGDMVPIGAMVDVRQTYGPDPVIRFNGYPAADLLGEADPRVLSSGEAMAQVTELAQQVLPTGMGIGWSDLSFQQATQGKAALVVFPLAVLLAFLVLAALYESWTLPLAVILIVPMTLLAALFGVWLTGGDNNVFVQVGLVVLMGLACKNAILIVEFARELELQGKGIVESALEACRLRLRPIVMTSVAFIAGTVPLVLSTGAGAEVRSVTGITVFAGMLGVTAFGLFLTPVFYVALRKLANRPLVSHGPVPAAAHD